ncbi:MAG: type II secretion system F family protein [Pseudomonadota bacterium]
MMELVETIMRPQFLVTLLAAVSAFATVITIAMPLLNRDRMAQRMKVMAIEREKMRAQRVTELKASERAGSLRQTPKGYMQQMVDALDLRSKFDNEEVRNKLKMAGLRGQAPLVTYMFFRIATPIVAFIAGFTYVFFIGDLNYPPIIKLAMAIAAGFVGYYLPNVFVENMVQKRQQSIKLAFPDSLDMLLICVQSGMSIEAAFGKVAKESMNSSIELAEELSLTTAELSYLQERRQAYENLAKRTGLMGVKAVATSLIQAERYGTPVSQALRVMAKENRDIRMGDAEQKAAALPPKLTVPMIIFFLPVLFLVILGPVGIELMEMDN